MKLEVLWLFRSVSGADVFTPSLYCLSPLKFPASFPGHRYLILFAKQEGIPVSLHISHAPQGCLYGFPARVLVSPFTLWQWALCCWGGWLISAFLVHSSASSVLTPCPVPLHCLGWMEGLRPGWRRGFQLGRKEASEREWRIVKEEENRAKAIDFQTWLPAAAPAWLLLFSFPSSVSGQTPVKLFSEPSWGLTISELKVSLATCDTSFLISICPSSVQLNNYLFHDSLPYLISSHAILSVSLLSKWYACMILYQRENSWRAL